MGLNEALCQEKTKYQGKSRFQGQCLLLSVRTHSVHYAGNGLHTIGALGLTLISALISAQLK